MVKMFGLNVIRCYGKYILGVIKMIEDRPTLIYFVQTVLNTFKRSEEQGYHTKDREYAITLLEKAMEHQNDIWNDAVEEAAKCFEQQNIPQFYVSEQIRKLKK